MGALKKGVLQLPCDTTPATEVERALAPPSSIHFICALLNCCYFIEFFQVTQYIRYCMAIDAPLNSVPIEVFKDGKHNGFI